MTVTTLLVIIALMILYDLSLHILELLQEFNGIGGTESQVGNVLLTPHPLEPGYLFDYLADGSVEKRRNVYQVFWTSTIPYPVNRPSPDCLPFPFNCSAV